MTLRVVSGKANTGKTGVVVRMVREALDAGRQPYVVVPSLPDAQRLLDELAVTHPLGVRATTFDRYLEDAWGQFGDGRTLVTPAQRMLLATSAARTVGASAALGRLAATCVAALADQAGESWRACRGPKGGPGVVLGRVLEGYAAALSRLGLVEAGEAAWHLACDDRVLGDPLVVHGFTDFTHSQEALVASARSATSVIVTLTWSDGFAPTEALDALLVRLAPDESEPLSSEAYHTAETLGALASGLFADPRPLDAGDALAFRTAQGAEAEALGIAKEIRRLREMEESGISATGKTVAVVFRDPERHYPFVREALDAAGIAADFDVRLPFSAVPFGSALTELLEFAVGSRRDHLTALLRSPFSGLDRVVASDLEASWRSRGIADAPRLVRELREAGGGLGAVAEAIRRHGRQPLDSAGAERVAAIVNDLFVLGYGRSGMLAGQDAEADAWALASAHRLLTDVATLDDRALTLADVLDALAQQTIGPREVDRPGHVQVTAVDRVRGRRFSVVVIGGLTADEFPASPAETMLPGTAIDEVLHSFGGAGEARLGPAYERMLFYAAITRARERLVLSACEADSDGEATRLSPLFEAVADFFRPADENAGLPSHELEPIARVPDGVNPATAREAEMAAAYGRDRTSPRGAAAAVRLGPRPAKLEEAASFAALADRDTFSPSEIESYLSCPYKWFYERQLHPRKLEREFELADQGSFAHELLALTYGALKDAGIPRMSQGVIDEAKATLDRVYSAACAESGAPAGVVEELQRRAAKAWALRILEDDVYLFDGFAPARLEWGFGGSDSSPMDMGGWFLRGFVDRIDVDADGRAIVIDYKRSGGPTADEIIAKRKVQVPLYLEAVKQLLGLEPVAGIYRGLRKRCDRGLVLKEALAGDQFKRTDLKSGEEFAAIHAEALRLAGQAVSGMRAGAIPCDPIAKACNMCSASLVCGSS